MMNIIYKEKLISSLLRLPVSAQRQAGPGELPADWALLVSDDYIMTLSCPVL